MTKVDVYYNPAAKDLWLRKGDKLTLINTTTTIDFDEQSEFIKIGQVGD